VVVLCKTEEAIVSKWEGDESLEKDIWKTPGKGIN
jgi:hypothetical protein